MATTTMEVLPDCLVHKIVSCLSFKEAAKMSILSKTWLQGWLTHPKLELKAQDCDEMKILDIIMERYRDSKIHIEKFEFLKAFSISGFIELFPLIDKWLDIVLHNGVKDIEYIDVRSSLYPLPIFTILAAKSLRELALWGCALMGGSLSGGVANCYTLRKLSLCDVCLNDNMLQTLLTSCPLIVNFFIEHCIGLEKIEVRNLQRVKSVSIKTLRKQRAKIQAPSLEHLFFSGYSIEELDFVEWQNLKSLELSGMTISNEFLETLFSKSQLLETLILVNVSNGWKRFNICGSESLKELKITAWKGIGEIDAPNLVSLEYTGDKIPELKITRESSQLKHSKIIFYCDNNFNASWFYKLAKFLSNSISWSQVSLIFFKCKEINMKKFKLHHRVVVPKVDILDVDIESSKGCPIVVDALLWCCHPRRINLSSTAVMIICFIDRLMYMKNLSHSTSHESKPWHSPLKEVKAYKLDWENDVWHPVELENWELTTRNLLEKEKYYFLLDW